MAKLCDASLNQDGSVQSLITDDGERLEADFYVDCSGFRSFLIGKCLNVPYIESSQSLLCDSAVAIPCSSDPERNGVNPFTTATALSSGWSWEVPLMHREGTGYVYSSQHLSTSKAEEELRELLGDKANDGSANHIKMRVGRYARSWEKNVVAIGLASSFVEPLESTTIFLIEYQLASLVSHFPASKVDHVRSDWYNKEVGSMYDEIRDFIVMHYILTKRTDSEFWRRVQEETVIPSSLEEKIERFRSGVITVDGLTHNIFESRSYASVMSGMDAGPFRGAPILEFQDEKDGLELIRKVDRVSKIIASVQPTHLEYLKQLHSSNDQRR